MITNHLKHGQQALGKGIFLYFQADTIKNPSNFPPCPYWQQRNLRSQSKTLESATERQVLCLCQKTETQRKLATTRRYSLFLRNCTAQHRNRYFPVGLLQPMEIRQIETFKLLDMFHYFCDTAPNCKSSSSNPRILPAPFLIILKFTVDEDKNLT